MSTTYIISFPKREYNYFLIRQNEAKFDKFVNHKFDLWKYVKYIKITNVIFPYSSLFNYVTGLIESSQEFKLSNEGWDPKISNSLPEIIIT